MSRARRWAMVGRQKLGAGDLGLPFIALAENLPVDRNPAGVTQAGSIEVATPGAINTGHFGYDCGVTIHKLLSLRPGLTIVWTRVIYT